MKDEQIKILVPNNRIITLKDLFEKKETARKQMSKLGYEEKIKILIDLQKIAYSWGKQKDVIIWQR